jgi:hypothetical protein
MAKQLICLIGLEVKKLTHVSMIAYCIMETNTKTWIRAPSVKLYGTRNGRQMRVPRPEEVPIKVVRYFPITPWVHRLFACVKSAKLLHWYGEERKKDITMRHHTDGKDWRTVNTMFYKNIGEEIRHLWFGLSTDGMNPFDKVRSNHSTWAVMLCIYNLPPWLCIKRSYI